MTVTSQEPVVVDGTTLNTYAWNISTFSGRSGVPEVRGEDHVVAYRNGQRWRRKYWEPRTETWSMWVLGCDADGNAPPSGTSRRELFNQNLFALKKLFSVRHRQLAIQKTVAMPGADLVLTAQAEVIAAWDPEMVAAGTRGTFTVDMHLADPMWYGPEIVENIEPGLTVPVTNPGTAAATKMTIVFGAGLLHPYLENTTLGQLVAYDADVLAADPITLDTDLFTAKNASSASVVGKVIAEGEEYSWMTLLPGLNNLEAGRYGGGSIGGGPLTLTYRPAYL